MIDETHCYSGLVWESGLVWLHSIDTGWYLVSGILLALHLSGCIGDLYMLMLFLTKYKDPDTLMRDTGPEQWIYMKQ